MSFNIKEIISNIFRPEEKENEAEKQKTADLQQKTNNVFGSNEQTASNTYNPFLKKNGELFNPMLDYQKLLDNSNVSQRAKDYITQATGLTPTLTQQKQVTPSTNGAYVSNNGDSTFKFNANADENSLASLDVTTELPKLNKDQISQIISKHFSNSTVIKPSDAEGIYNAQQQSGMSALAILGIGALESGYGTSNIAKKKNNIWGWNATNVNPGGNATTFSQMSDGALEFANAFMKTYYNGYGAKSIKSAGTGDNPSGKGYAYNNDGSINSAWATSVGSIMKNFYNTAKTVTPAATTNTGNTISDSAQKYIGTPYVWGGESMSEGGMDCSGFVYNALKDAGYNIGRTTAQGYRSYGSEVNKSNMQPGDLLFFGKNGKATHIGIYLGNGQMIHSSGGSSNTKSNPGKGVSIANVNHRSDFIEARRY